MSFVCQCHHVERGFLSMSITCANTHIHMHAHKHRLSFSVISCGFWC
jgi:hypothetical protein